MTAIRTGAGAGVAAQLEGSALVRSAGWRVIRLVPDSVVRRLAEEALRCHGAATEAVVETPGDDDPHRGNPDRWLESAAGGPVLQSLYLLPALQVLIRKLTGVAWRPSGPQATYSYYRSPGHYLGLHRDVDVCDLAVIACVADEGPADGLSGALCLYPGRAAEHLGDIRADRRGMVPLVLEPGQALVMLGGVIPHELKPVGAARRRIVAPMCFQLAG